MKFGERDEFYLSKRWKRVARRIMVRDGYQCQVSKRYGKTIQAEIVHHIFPREFFPEYEWSEWNLISVSKRTHARLHTDTGELTEIGKDLLIRTAKKYNITIPEKYLEKSRKKLSHKTMPEPVYG